MYVHYYGGNFLILPSPTAFLEISKGVRIIDSAILCPALWRFIFTYVHYYGGNFLILPSPTAFLEISKGVRIIDSAILS